MASDAPEASQKDDSSSDDEPGREYEVERILGKRENDGETQYKVKWKHYKTPQWLPSDQMTGCSILIDEFEKELLAPALPAKSRSPSPRPKPPELKQPAPAAPSGGGPRRSARPKAPPPRLLAPPTSSPAKARARRVGSDSKTGNKSGGASSHPPPHDGAVGASKAGKPAPKSKQSPRGKKRNRALLEERIAELETLIASSNPEDRRRADIDLTQLERELGLPGRSAAPSAAPAAAAGHDDDDGGDDDDDETVPATPPPPKRRRIGEDGAAAATDGADGSTASPAASSASSAGRPEPLTLGSWKPAAVATKPQPSSPCVLRGSVAKPSAGGVVKPKPRQDMFRAAMLAASLPHSLSSTAAAAGTQRVLAPVGVPRKPANGSGAVTVAASNGASGADGVAAGAPVSAPARGTGGTGKVKRVPKQSAKAKAAMAAENRPKTPPGTIQIGDDDKSKDEKEEKGEVAEEIVYRIPKKAKRLPQPAASAEASSNAGSEIERTTTGLDLGESPKRTGSWGSKARSESGGGSSSSELSGRQAGGGGGWRGGRSGAGDGGRSGGAGGGGSWARRASEWTTSGGSERNSSEGGNDGQSGSGGARKCGRSVAGGGEQAAPAAAPEPTSPESEQRSAFGVPLSSISSPTHAGSTETPPSQSVSPPGLSRSLGNGNGAGGMYQGFGLISPVSTPAMPSLVPGGPRGFGFGMIPPQYQFPGVALAGMMFGQPMVGPSFAVPPPPPWFGPPGGGS